MQAMVKITLPDGSEKQFESASVTGTDIAASIGAGLAKAAIAIAVDGKELDLTHEISNDASVNILTLKDPRGLDAVRHSLTAQILARAVKELYPDAQLAIGPTIDNGAYYDIAFSTPISSTDLPAIEKKMQELINKNSAVTRQEWPAEKVKEYFASQGEGYKVQLVEDLIAKGNLIDGKRLSVYLAHDPSNAAEKFDFLDLCVGPHVQNFSQIKLAFKLTTLAGAYWRGDANNEQLTRIYMVAFPSQKELDDYLHMMEEAAKRDHRKIGKEMELFTFFPESIGPGLPLWLPKGTIIRDELEGWAREVEKAAGYERVVTPQITKESLFHQSGHLPYYAEDMYSPIDIDGDKYYLKPMNCPFHHHVYISKPRSYRDLPLRVAEYGNCYRYEAHGGLSGLMRVRAMCMNDAHLYCRFDQAKDEFIKVMHMHAHYYRTLGISDENFYMRLSMPDMAKLDKYVDDPQAWKDALSVIKAAMEESGLKYYEAAGEAAFYGPKVDFQAKTAIGVEYSISTNQLDFLATKRFNLTYTGEDGKDHPVYVIHRAPLGTHERFVAFLIEHFAGNFPLWLAPQQVVVSGIVEKHNDHVEKIVKRLKDAGLRAEGDYRNEKINYKIREHMHSKVTMVGVVGDKEAEEDTITIRRLGSEKQTNYKMEEFIAKCQEEIRTKALPPEF